MLIGVGPRLIGEVMLGHEWGNAVAGANFCFWMIDGKSDGETR
ncbi:MULTISPECIES: hypothetical protein [unclassified Bradyrhizobium]|nr:MULTISPECIES: hypothetical protein [unclassified Bradyrhizobium]